MRDDARPEDGAPAAVGKDPAAFELPVRVYYEDTDTGGVVYYANYLRFLERARTEWLRSAGFEQQRLIEQDAILFAVRRVEIDYLLPARLDDALIVTAAVESCGRVGLVFRQAVQRDGQTLVEARVKVVCLDSERFKPAPIPDHLRQRLSGQR